MEMLCNCLKDPRKHLLEFDWINTKGPVQNGQHFPDGIFKQYSEMEICLLKFP